MSFVESVIQLKAGREKAVLRRHPWIFSGAIAVVRGDPLPGATVRVVDSQDRFLGWGAFSPRSQIRVRLWSWVESEQVDADFFRRRLSSAIDLRQAMLADQPSDAWRIVHGESDGLPGLVVDRYGDQVVVQILSAGPEYWRDTLVELLDESLRPQGIYERSEVDVRDLEGLPARQGALCGQPNVNDFLIQEHGLHFWVNLATGQKTGFYLDQRDNRALVRRLAAGRQVLDCFSYSGGFAIAAAAGGATSVQAVETSAPAIEAGRANQEANGLPEEAVTWVYADVFRALREYRDRARQYDMVILDPPKFAPTTAQVERAARGYKDINLLAFKLLRPGGLLVSFSCSGGVSAELFQKIVAGAALDAGVEARITAWLQQAADHPVALNFPEGAYLKGLVVQVS